MAVDSLARKLAAAAIKKNSASGGGEPIQQPKELNNLDLSYGEQAVTYDTADGITISGQAQLTYSDGTITEADKKKVQFTKVTIATTDDTNFPGMNGRYAIVPGFTNNGFHYGTVVCSQSDSAYEFPFIGSITSEMASGTVVKPSVAPTYVSVVEPEVTFTYEYLW